MKRITADAITNLCGLAYEYSQSTREQTFTFECCVNGAQAIIVYAQGKIEDFSNPLQSRGDINTVYAINIKDADGSLANMAEMMSVGELEKLSFLLEKEGTFFIEKQRLESAETLEDACLIVEEAMDIDGITPEHWKALQELARDKVVGMRRAQIAKTPAEEMSALQEEICETGWPVLLPEDKMQLLDEATGGNGAEFYVSRELNRADSIQAINIVARILSYSQYTFTEKQKEELWAKTRSKMREMAQGILANAGPKEREAVRETITNTMDKEIWADYEPYIFGN